MRVLMLTWEFPPFISGGLGIACYGLIKAMLGAGVEVDMILPTSDDVYFPLRKAEDADDIPVAHVDPAKRGDTAQAGGSAHERLRTAGVPLFSQAYWTPALNFHEVMEWFRRTFAGTGSQEFEQLKSYLAGSEDIFRKMQEFTSRAVRYAPFLSCDIIHAHDWFTYPAGMLLKRALGKPLVTHIHATEFDRAGGPGDGRIHNIEYAGLMAADRVIAVSNYTKKMIVEKYLIPENKVRIVHNAHSVGLDAMQKRKIFKDPMILFLGRVTIQKGPDYFLEVAQRVLAEFPNARFVMSGAGDMFPKILKRSAAKKLKDRFLFTGFLTREQVEEILAATDILLFPSVSEPFGIAPLEAMAHGAVAIISKQSGVAEVIKNAYPVDFWDINKTAEIIIRLLNDPEERLKMAKAGREEAMTIKWKEAAEKAINVYKEI